MSGIYAHAHPPPTHLWFEKHLNDIHLGLYQLLLVSSVWFRWKFFFSPSKFQSTSKDILVQLLVMMYPS